jgi:DNA end-binding protein Ku
MGAMGRFVLRGSEYFCLIRPKGEALALETMFLAEDVRSQAEIEEAVSDTEVKDAELKLAQQVLESLVGEFDPSELTSEYRGNLRAMLEAKLEGKEIAKPEPVPETPVVDLMEALKRSVAEAQGRKKTAGSDKKRAASKSGSRTRRAPARKSA